MPQGLKPKDETLQALYMRLAEGSVKAAWLLQAIYTATESPGDWVVGSHNDWHITTGLTPVQVRDAMLYLDRLGLITRKQAYIKTRRAALLHVRLARNPRYAVDHFKPHVEPEPKALAHGGGYPSEDVNVS